MTPLRCLIVDDEPLAVNVIVNFLARLGIRDPFRCTNTAEARQLLREREFDVLFLDIRMPKISGLDLLRAMSNRPLVVITTAYRDYAVEGFELEVQDYLVKPFSFSRFQQAMEKIARLRDDSQGPAPVAEKNAIFLKVDRRWLKVPVMDILYIESLRDYVRVVTTGGEHICLQSLTEITASLPAERFARIHRSFTVAVDKVDQVKRHQVQIGGKAIPIARAHRQDTLRRLGL